MVSVHTIVKARYTRSGDVEVFVDTKFLNMRSKRKFLFEAKEGHGLYKTKLNARDALERCRLDIGFIMDIYGKGHFELFKNAAIRINRLRKEMRRLRHVE